jgi:methylated-DNA-[protein]-cysteine S-methyltransferase
MNIQIIAEGPALKVHCEVRCHQLVHIQLSVHEQKGLHWSCQGDDTSRLLEQAISGWLNAYCQKQQPRVSFPLEIEILPPFTKRVLKYLLGLPFGQIATYQDVAIRLANPQASRAVGNACGRNPLPLIIPCHRIIAKNGLLGGYSAGCEEVKKRLLSFEGVLI